MNTEYPKVALVSGGSRGLGQAVVEHLLDSGCKVATFSRSDSEFISEQKNNKNFFYKQIDITDYKSVKSYTAEVQKVFGRLDYLINNAGINIEQVLPLMRPEEIHKVISVNLESVICLTQLCSRLMMLNQQGSIINISSINALRGHKGVSVYSATKAGLDGLTRSLAKELGPMGIRVNAIAPGYFHSEMTKEFEEKYAKAIAKRTPLGRLGCVGDIVSVVGFLLSDDAQFITGQTIAVDGGFTC